MKTFWKNSFEIANVGVGDARTPTYSGAPGGTRTHNLLIRRSPESNLQGLFPLLNPQNGSITAFLGLKRSFLHPPVPAQFANCRQIAGRTIRLSFAPAIPTITTQYFQGNAPEFYDTS